MNNTYVFLATNGDKWTVEADSFARAIFKSGLGNRIGELLAVVVTYAIGDFAGKRLSFLPGEWMLTA